MRKNLTHLIGLKMTYEMPLHIVRHRHGFGAELVGTALTKYTLTGIISLPQRFQGVEFRHSDENNPIRD